jgi:hypothetical protein
VRALRAALLTLENTLLIASYAMYGAVIYQLDDLNVHHFVLVCWLSIVSLLTAVALPRSHRYVITTGFAPVLLAPARLRDAPAVAAALRPRACAASPCCCSSSCRWRGPCC